MERRTTKVEQQIECIACPWNKNCIEPPTMTREEVEATLDKAKAEGKDKEGSLASGMLSVMFFGCKDKEATVCPTFADALRLSPEMSQQIKAIMQGK